MRRAVVSAIFAVPAVGFLAVPSHGSTPAFDLTAVRHAEPGAAPLGSALVPLSVFGGVVGSVTFLPMAGDQPAFYGFLPDGVGLTDVPAVPAAAPAPPPPTPPPPAPAPATASTASAAAPSVPPWPGIGMSESAFEAAMTVRLEAEGEPPAVASTFGCIVWNESRGDLVIPNSAGSGAEGAYQIMPSTWTANGGTGMPQDASALQQDRVAYAIYQADGWHPWSGDGCV